MAAVVPAASGTLLRAVRDAAGALWSCARQEKCVASKQWMVVVIVCADDSIPLTLSDAELIASVARHIGLCSEVLELINLTCDKISEGLAGAVQQMAQRNLSHLMIYYAGHAFVRYKRWSTRVDTGEHQSFHLESSVQHAIQDARSLGRLGPCKVVYFVDACMEFQDDEPSNVSGSAMSEEEEDLMQYFAYSVSRGKPQADNGLFATVLAYCLSCRVQTLSSLFRNVKDLVSQLTYWRQIPYTSHVENDIQFFPRAGGDEIQRPMTEDQRNSRLFESTFFLSRYLARLTSDKLLEWRYSSEKQACKINPNFWLNKQQKHILSTFSRLREIAHVFEAKKHLFHSNGWTELELIAKCPCNDLGHFLTTLKKVEQLPIDLEPKSLPREIRDCLVDAFRKHIRDEYDPWPKNWFVTVNPPPAFTC
eukprot:s219_g51.t1